MRRQLVVDVRTYMYLQVKKCGMFLIAFNTCVVYVFINAKVFNTAVSCWASAVGYAKFNMTSG